jgi:DNA (cytosine-5)-methyltransferase 1
MTNVRRHRPVALDFFAGSGLVSHALGPFFDVAWANDNCPHKAAIYTANHQRPFCLGNIEEIDGRSIPAATLAWASFPCQDLSLAGAVHGIQAKRSGLVWEWLRVLDEMKARPPIIVAENVLGLVSSHNGASYHALHAALNERGYRVGAMVIDAARWLPQSRPRVFVVGVAGGLSVPESLVGDGPNWLHPAAIIRAAAPLRDWLWWRLPEPGGSRPALDDVLEWDAVCHSQDAARGHLSLVPRRHYRRLVEMRDRTAVPGYKRIRSGRQVLELRFDGVAGCLRTARGGSSRQYLVLRRDRRFHTRLLTVREAARLMGAPESYRIPGSYNAGYSAMGDAVAVPVARHLAETLLLPLAAG